jgi:hypothetical protein
MTSSERRFFEYFIISNHKFDVFSRMAPHEARA